MCKEGLIHVDTVSCGRVSAASTQVLLRTILGQRIRVFLLSIDAMAPHAVHDRKRCLASFLVPGVGERLTQVLKKDTSSPKTHKEGLPVLRLPLDQVPSKSSKPCQILSNIFSGVTLIPPIRSTITQNRVHVGLAQHMLHSMQLATVAVGWETK